MRQRVDMLKHLKRRMDAKWRAHDQAIQHSMPPAIVERTFVAYLDALEALSRAERVSKREP